MGVNHTGSKNPQRAGNHREREKFYTYLFDIQDEKIYEKIDKYPYNYNSNREL